MKLLVCVLCLGVLSITLCAKPLQIDQDLLDAIRQVESGGDACAIGDKHLFNKAYGPYQIREPYYNDAVRANPSLADGGRSFKDVWGRGSEQYSEEVIKNYMGRYATEARLGRPPTDEDIARIHNGGPNGYKNPNTIGYWNKVLRAMENPSRPKQDVANCALKCNMNECCGSTACNCLDSTLAIVPCDSLYRSGAMNY